MVTPFPRSRARRSDPLGWALAMHSAETVADEETELGWARWLFQSVRAQCEALVFQTADEDRNRVIADWQRFAGEAFLPVLAPALLNAWRLAQRDAHAEIVAIDRELDAGLPPPAADRSIAAGAILLERTRGAKHEAALGHFRQSYDAGEASGHLAVAWAVVAALFQLPPADLLMEYLREEWLVSAKGFPNHAEPQGPLGFHALATRALHQAGFHPEFAIVEPAAE